MRDSGRGHRLARGGSRARSSSPTASSICSIPAMWSCWRRPGREGGALVVGVNSDASVRRLGKGAGAPAGAGGRPGPGAGRPRRGGLRGPLRRGHAARADPGARARRAGQGRRLPAGQHRRRRLGRGARRPGRAGAAGRTAFQLLPSWSVSVPRPDGRANDQLRPARARAARQSLCRRLLPHPDGRHPGALHGERRARRARLQEGHRAKAG